MKRSILGRTVGQAFSTMLSDFPVPRCHAKTIDGKGYELGWLAGWEIFNFFNVMGPECVFDFQ